MSRLQGSKAPTSTQVSMADGALQLLYVLVTVHPDGTENLMYTSSGKAVVPLVSANPDELERFKELALAKALEKGDRLRVIEFGRVKHVDIGGPNTQQDLEEQN